MPSTLENSQKTVSIESIPEGFRYPLSLFQPSRHAGCGYFAWSTKYAGGNAAVNELLGISIDRTRRWTKESIIAGYRKVVDEWGVSPSQLLSDYRALKVELDPEYAAELQRLIGATTSQFPGGSREVYAALSFKPPSRPRKKRTRAFNT